MSSAFLSSTTRTLTMWFLPILWCCVDFAMAQTVVAPTNASLPDQALEQVMTVQNSNGQIRSPQIYPLTPAAGLGGTSVAIQQVHYSGTLISVDPGLSNVADVNSTTVAYVQCDPNGTNIGPNTVVNTLISQSAPPLAVVLYSLEASSCNISGNFTYGSVFTMMSETTSNYVLNAVLAMNSSPMVVIEALNSTDSDDDDSSSTDPQTPTTAVAMSILYSITGVITLLFLIIIATGAIRAHRNPERYGPRSAVAGRPRQSRAKGLARAMLETIPIVKFGDPEPVKQTAADLELEHGLNRASEEQHAANVQQPTQTSETETRAAAAADTTESGLGPNTASAAAIPEDVNNTADLGCSICTEDFTKGEDVRVLPCNHKYHPACIDPWLLNVSGTCPLCRVDLRPITSRASNQDAENLAPPLNETDADAETGHGRRRLSRYLDLARLRHAPPDERIQALRQMREEQQQQQQQQQPTTESHDGVESADERSRRARLTSRLGAAFRIRTRTQGRDDTTGSAETSTPQ